MATSIQERNVSSSRTRSSKQKRYSSSTAAVLTLSQTIKADAITPPRTQNDSVLRAMGRESLYLAGNTLNVQPDTWRWETSTVSRDNSSVAHHRQSTPLVQQEVLKNIPPRRPKSGKKVPILRVPSTQKLKDAQAADKEKEKTGIDIEQDNSTGDPREPEALLSARRSRSSKSSTSRGMYPLHVLQWDPPVPLRSSHSRKRDDAGDESESDNNIIGSGAIELDNTSEEKDADQTESVRDDVGEPEFLEEKKDNCYQTGDEVETQEEMLQETRSETHPDMIDLQSERITQESLPDYIEPLRISWGTHSTRRRPSLTSYEPITAQEKYKEFLRQASDIRAPPAVSWLAILQTETQEQLRQIQANQQHTLLLCLRALATFGMKAGDEFAGKIDHIKNGYLAFLGDGLREEMAAKNALYKQYGDVVDEALSSANNTEDAHNSLQNLKTQIQQIEHENQRLVAFLKSTADWPDPKPKTCTASKYKPKNEYERVLDEITVARNKISELEEQKKKMIALQTLQNYEQMINQARDELEHINMQIALHNDS
eukprot:m.29807 g.29807  ORF g.29807 m.29807 type:complete len:542 (-) comp8138_c0_seq1:1079-2704(-)